MGAPLYARSTARVRAAGIETSCRTSPAYPRAHPETGRHRSSERSPKTVEPTREMREERDSQILEAADHFPDAEGARDADSQSCASARGVSFDEAEGRCTRQPRDAYKKKGPGTPGLLREGASGKCGPVRGRVCGTCHHPHPLTWALLAPGRSRMTIIPVPRHGRYSRRAAGR